MKNLMLSVAALAATISLSAQATPMCEATFGKTSSYQTEKQIDASLSRDVQTVATAQPVVAAFTTTIDLASAGRVPMTVNNVVGDAAYAAERLVKNAVDTGACTMSSQVPGLPAGVNCAIQMPGKVLTVALVGANNVISGVVVDVVYSVPSNILRETSSILAATGNRLNSATGVLGYPLIIVSGVLTGTGYVLQMTAYVVQTGVTGIVTTAALIVCTPFEAISQLLSGRPDQFLYSITFGLIENTLTGLCNLVAKIPASPCDGVGRDGLCQPGPAAAVVAPVPAP